MPWGTLIPHLDLPRPRVRDPRLQGSEQNWDLHPFPRVGSLLATDAAWSLRTCLIHTRAKTSARAQTQVLNTDPGANDSSATSELGDPLQTSILLSPTLPR